MFKPIKMKRVLCLAGLMGLLLMMIASTAVGLTEKEWFDLFTTQIEQEEYTKAIDTLEEAMEEHPESSKLRTSYQMTLQVLSVQARKEGDYALAAEIIDRVWKKDPEAEGVREQYIQAHLNYGVVLLEREANREALREFRIVLEVEPDHPEARAGAVAALNNLAEEAVEAGRHGEAEDFLSESLTLNEAQAAAHYLMARTQLGLDRYNPALIHFLSAKALGQAGLDPLIAQIQRVIETSSGYPSVLLTERIEFRVVGSGDEKAVLAKREEFRGAYQEIAEIMGPEFSSSLPNKPIILLVYGEDAANALGFPPDLPFQPEGEYDGRMRLSFSQLALEGDALETVLTHTMAHAVLYQKAENRLPMWMNEGIVYHLLDQRVESFPSQNYRESLKENLARGEWTDLSLLAGSWNELEADSARGAYKESLAAVNYLLERYGEERLNRYMDLVAEGTDPEEALQRNETFLLSMAELNARLKAELREERN